MLYLYMIREIIEFKRLRNELLKEYKDENIVDRFSEIYHVKFKVDRAARLYAVINPLLLNIKMNNTSQIYEYTKDGMTDITYIKQWIFTNLMAVEKMLAARNLLDILVFDIKSIDIDGSPSGNYLVTFSPYNFNDYNRAKKNLYKLLGGIIGVGIITLTILKYVFIL